MLHTLVVTCFFQLLLPYYQLENNLAMISDLWHEEGIFTLTNATHSIFLLFCVIVCKLRPDNLVPNTTPSEYDIHFKHV